MGLEFPVISNFRNSKPIIANIRFLLIHQWTQATASRQSPRPVPLASHLSTIQIKSRFSLAGIQWGSSWGTVGCVWQSLERIPVDLGGVLPVQCVWSVHGVCGEMHVELWWLQCSSAPIVGRIVDGEKRRIRSSTPTCRVQCAFPIQITQSGGRSIPFRIVCPPSCRTGMRHHQHRGTAVFHMW